MNNIDNFKKFNENKIKQLLKFKNPFKKFKIGDEILCINNYKFLTTIDTHDYTYVSKTGDDSHIKDILDNQRYLFESGKYYKIVDVYKHSITIESNLKAWKIEGNETQIFTFKEDDYFPKLSNYFEV